MKDTRMQKMMHDVDGYESSMYNKSKAKPSIIKHNNDKRQHKSAYGQKSQPTTKPKSSSKPRTNVKSKSSDDNYPWTSLIGVKDVAKLNAIQQMFGLSSRTEALELVFKHCQGLIEKKDDRIKYNVLRDVFIQKNMPKAKARYEKYFGKNKK